MGRQVRKLITLALKFPNLGPLQQKHQCQKIIAKQVNFTQENDQSWPFLLLLCLNCNRKYI